MVADDPACKIELKIFHSVIQNNTEQLKREGHFYRDIPIVRRIKEQEIRDHYMQVKLDVIMIIEQEMEKLKLLKKKNIKPTV